MAKKKQTKAGVVADKKPPALRKRKGTIEEQEEKDRCNKIRSMLRRAWSRDPVRYEALRKARRAYAGDNKRQRFEYQCAICGEWWKQSDVSVDHCTPCGSFLNMEQIGEWVKRLFCGELQVLDKECHLKKTKQEREDRKNEDIHS